MLPGKEREDHSSREKGLAKGLASKSSIFKSLIKLILLE